MTDFEKLFSENREFIFKYLMKMTRDVSLSEELTQETFFRAYMNYASLEHKEKASVWLCQIAKNIYFHATFTAITLRIYSLRPMLDKSYAGTI